MPWKIAIALTLTFGFTISAADDKPAANAKPKVNFADNVSAIFNARCNSCHNADKAKGGLALETYGAAMQGGGSGKVIEPGDLDGSHLWQLVTHAEEPKMPPSAPKIPDAELAVIKAWIEAGAPETSGSVVAMKTKPKFEFKLDPSSLGKPVGPPAMPEGLLTEPIVVSPKANAIVALASSPWAPLVAVAGHKQVLLYQAQKNRLVGILPFPEGTIHVLKFSRNGSLLLAAGGRGGQSGLAVVFDVKTGRRVFEIGKEYDVVLAADISPDHGQVALGGPSKIVRVYNTNDGQLQFEMKKHTEWITALEFSPDGVLLATGDRNNGLEVWEAQTGREFFDLKGHTASITDVSWRLDSNVVASAAEDGTIRLWEMENGNPIKTWGAHPGGITSARFAKDGRIVTTGRDRSVSLWDQNGGKQKDLEKFNDLALRAVFADDDTKVVAGDWSGEVRVYSAKEGTRIANLLANPLPIAARLEQTKSLAQAARGTADVELKNVEPLQASATEKTSFAAKVQQALAEAQADAQLKSDEVVKLEKLEADKVKSQTMAVEALKLAQGKLGSAETGKITAERAIGETANQEKSLSEQIPAAKQAVEKALNEKIAQDQALASAVEALKSASTRSAADQASASLSQALARSSELMTALGNAGKREVETLANWEKAVAAKAAAPGLLAAASENLRQASEMFKNTQASMDEANKLRNDAAKLLADARSIAQNSKNLAEARKHEAEIANAAKSAAEKALAERKAIVDGLVRKAEELRAEVEALESDQNAANAARKSKPE